MNSPSQPKNSYRVLFLLLVILLSLQGVSCLPVEYKVVPQVEETAKMGLPADEVYLTFDSSHLLGDESKLIMLFPVGHYKKFSDRNLLEDLENGLSVADDRIEIIEATRLTDTVFPNGPWTVKRLLDAETKHRLEELRTNYLIIVLPSKTELFMVGPFIPGLGVAGGKEEIMLSATILDLEKSCIIRRCNVKAKGSIAVLAYGITLMILPKTYTSALESLSEAIANVLTDATPSGPIRVVVVAAHIGAPPQKYAPSSD